MHPGGPRILDVVERELDLPAGRAGGVPGGARRARQLLVADGAADPGRGCAGRRVPPRRVVLLAFGPGLTLYAALLERRS